MQSCSYKSVTRIGAGFHRVNPYRVAGSGNKESPRPDRVVRRIAANPTVYDRYVYDWSWAVSWGNMRDDFELNDGSSFRFDSRFTATIARRGEAWKVVAFHASVNAFDNPILGFAARMGGAWSGLAGARPDC